MSLPVFLGDDLVHPDRNELHGDRLGLRQQNGLVVPVRNRPDVRVVFEFVDEDIIDDKLIEGL